MTALREIFAEQWLYRELLIRMTLRDLLLRYKQTAMGFAWAIFMPLVNTAIFSVIFTRVASIEVGGPYPVYAFCGLVAWNFFASALRFSVVSLTSNPSLVTKLYFPREIFPFSAVLALFTSAIALLLAMGNLFYRDVKYLFEIVISVWMFASSVVYPIDQVGGRLGAVLALNPMTHLIDALRAVVIDNQMPSPAFAITAACTVVAFLGAWLVFHAAEFDFAENL